ncbi:hypothetical protein OAO16_00515 [Opitutales bacterium]|nr:hypothetical protein [Opitutales bacterium]
MAGQPEPSGGKSKLGGCPGFPDPFECPTICKYNHRLGLCVAHRIAMGICLPCRYDHGVLVGK